MPFDTHNHTEFSFDAEMKSDEALQRASEYGLGLIFTEHYDLNELQENGSPVTFPIDDYLTTYDSIRGDQALLGIELGLDDRSDYLEKNRKIAADHDFDMVIGSVHNIRDYDICTDQKKNFLGKEDFFTRYLIYAEHVIHTSPFIDSFAHIDYPCRYLEYEDNVLRYHDFSWLIDNFLNALIQHGICFEINLRLVEQQPFRDGLSGILERYRRLGGRYVTIGGDNHSPETIGRTYPIGRELAWKHDLTPVYFKKRQLHIDDPQNFIFPPFVD